MVLRLDWKCNSYLDYSPQHKENPMCESSVFFKDGTTETLVMENVAVITPSGENTFFLKGLLGEQKEVTGVIEDINLMGHKIILRPLP